MAGSVNKVILVGNLTADPEARSLNSGKTVVKLRVATNESWRDKNTGERKERSEFHNVVIYGEGLARVAQNYLRKGSKVYIEGQLQTRKWQDKDGQDRYTTEIMLQGYSANLTMLDGGKPRDEGAPQEPGKKMPGYAEQMQGHEAPLGDAGDYFDVDRGEEIPFNRMEHWSERMPNMP